MNLKVHLLLSTTILLLQFSLNLELLAAVKVSQASGNWSNAGVWGGTAPLDNDDVIISAGTVINLNASLPATSSLNSLTIEPGASLIVTVNGSTLRIKGDIVNNGTLNLWQDNTLQSDIILYGSSAWSGTGVWNLSGVDVRQNELEFATGLGITLNEDLSASAGGSFNKINKYQDISLTFKGTANATLPALASNFFYGNITVDKASGIVSFRASPADNNINFNGNLFLVRSTDRLNIGDFNTLRLQKSVSGAGFIGGGFTCSIIIDNPLAPVIDPLRLISGTSFKNLTVNRQAGVVLNTGFNVRENLVLNNQCRLVLSSQTLSLGVNGTNPTEGNFVGDGYLVGSASSSISIRGKGNLTLLRFARLQPSEYTVNNLVIDKISGTTGLLDGSGLIVKGTLNISDQNVFSIGPASLILNSVAGFNNSGCLRGSEESSLGIEGTGKTAYTLQFDQFTAGGNTFKSYTQSRRTAISLGNNLNISERVSLTGDSSILISNGNLSLLSSATKVAAIGPLMNGADVVGDVNVQVYVSGNHSDLRYRGYRSFSSPINDDLITPGNKKSLAQLKNYIIITGPGGISNGFDQGGNAQPFAQTLLFNNPLATPGQSLFIPVTNIDQSLKQGTGFFAFFRGKQMGSYSLNSAKLNSPYAAPDPVTVVYKGSVNKLDIPAITLYNTQDTTDEYRGYNLIGNPYPSAIDWTKMERSAGVNDEVLILKPGGGTATYINGFSNNGGSPIIQTGQGFYVRTAINGSTVTFKETCKTSSYPARLLNAPLENKLSSRTFSFSGPNTVKSDYEVIRLNLGSGLDKDETTIVFTAGERPEADYNDAMYFGGGAVNLSSLSSDDKKMAISFMPDLRLTDTVRLFVNAVKGGTYTLNFTDVPSTYMHIFLKDEHSRELTLLKKDLSYPFEIDRNNPATFGGNRFALVFRKDGREKPNSEGRALIPVYPNPVSDEVFFDVSSLPEQNKRLMICDMQGKVWESLFFKRKEKVTIKVNWFEPGLYVAKFRSEDDGKVLGETLFIKY